MVDYEKIIKMLLTIIDETREQRDMYKSLWQGMIEEKANGRAEAISE